MGAQVWFWDEVLDEFIRKHYDPTVRGRPQWIADQLGRPRWVINRRAQSLGLAQLKERAWNREDEKYLETHYHHASIKVMQKRLHRTATAIRLKAKRMGLTKKGEGYTASSLAEGLGVDPHWVTSRIREGMIEASHRNTERSGGQRGDYYLITERAVIDFIRQYPYEIDLRKVDRLWFMDLVAFGLNLIPGKLAKVV